MNPDPNLALSTAEPKAASPPQVAGCPIHRAASSRDGWEIIELNCR